MKYMIHDTIHHTTFLINGMKSVFNIHCLITTNDMRRLNFRLNFLLKTVSAVKHSLYWHLNLSIASCNRVFTLLIIKLFVKLIFSFVLVFMFFYFYQNSTTFASNVNTHRASLLTFNLVYYPLHFEF